MFNQPDRIQKCTADRYKTITLEETEWVHEPQLLFSH